MLREIPLNHVYFDSEPDIAVVNGPLCSGYREIIAGRLDEGHRIIKNFLVSVYVCRKEERSTEYYVRQIYRERRKTMPESKEKCDISIVLEAAGRRVDQLHLPLLHNILRSGYTPAAQEPVTMTGQSGKYYVHDGKNRCSILAALGRETIKDVRVIK